MTHLAMKKLVVMSLAAAPVLAGKSSSKANKVTMSISEIEREMSIPLHEGGSKSSKVAVSHSPSSSHAPSSAETGAAAEGVTSNGKSGKSGRSKGGKPSDSMSMPDNALSTPLHNGSKSGKVVTAFGKSNKADAKAFKGKSTESFGDSKSLKSSKGSKNMSLSVGYDESAMPSSAPSTFPSFAAIVDPVTSKPTLGNFLFGAKTAKLMKPDGEDEGDAESVTDATTSIYEAIFGKGDEDDGNDPIRKKALWEWEQGHN